MCVRENEGFAGYTGPTLLVWACLYGIDMSSEYSSTAERPDSVSSPPVDTHTHTLDCHSLVFVPTTEETESYPIVSITIYPHHHASYCAAFKRPFSSNNRQGGREVGLGVVVVIIDVPYLRSYRSYTCTTYYYIVRKGVIRLWNSFWTRQASRRAALGRTRHTQRNS